MPDLMLEATTIGLGSNIVALIGGITVLVQCYKVRRIFREHFNTKMGGNIYFGVMYIFVFHVMYLQYKVNRFEYDRVQPPPLPGGEPIASRRPWPSGAPLK